MTLPQALAELTLQPDVGTSLQPKNERLQCTYWDQPYHPLSTGGGFTLRLHCEDPAATAETTPIIGIANDVRNPFAFIVIDANRSATRLKPLKLRISDLHSSITAAAELLIEGWEQNVLREVLDDLGRGITGHLRSQGYSVGT